MIWPLFVIAAATFSAARYSIIRHSLRETPSLAIAFASRAFALVVLLPMLGFIPLVIPGDAAFIGVTALTAVLTAVASVLQYHAMRRSALADTIPWLALVPLFMLVSVYFLYDEVPGMLSLAGVCILSGGVWLYARGRTTVPSGPAAPRDARRATLAMLGSTIIIGLTTALDRIPIASARTIDPDAGAFSYTFIWHVFSAVVFMAALPFVGRSSASLAGAGRRLWFQRALWLQAMASGVAFLLQMQAVSISIAEQIPAGVVLVKAVSLLQLPLAMLFGQIVLKERISLLRGAGSLVMLAGAVIIILGRS